CGKANYKRTCRIINGDIVKPLYKYPWMVPLFKDSQLVCSGALISKKYILTAARCFFRKESLKIMNCLGSNTTAECYNPMSNYTIHLLGKNKLRRKKSKIKRIVIHPRFNYIKAINDVALIELKHPLECNKRTSPICLPTNKEMYKDGQKIFVAGWGKNDVFESEGHERLREGVMKEIPSKYCKWYRLPNKTLQQYHCAVGTNQTSCYGDSGSSAFIQSENRFYSLGIVSHGALRSCNPVYPVVFAKVLYFLNWIKKHVEDLPEP
ncbi:transmembrane protease serine 5, partial [Nephila pilipes]